MCGLTNSALEIAQQLKGGLMNKVSRKSLRSNAANNQRLRIEQALKDTPGGLTSIQFYEDYDIQQPSARIWELRWIRGLNIVTEKTVATTAQGGTHDNARYVLLSGKWQGRKRA